MQDAPLPDDLPPMAERHTIDLDPAPDPDLTPTPPTQSRWGWVIDRNPLFLISGVFMLGGCFLVSRHIHDLDPAEVGHGVVLRLLIALLVVLNIYEFAVIGLGLWLSRSRALVRDARHLLGLALLLLVDMGFVYNESGIADPRAGAAIACVAALLAAVKVGLVLWWLGMSISIRAGVVLGVSLVSLYALPVVVRLLADDGFLYPPHAMAVWAGVGVVVALHALPGRWLVFGPAASPDHRRLQRLVAGGLIGLPVLSLVAHAGAVLWVYENAFEPSMLSPMLLGLAAVLLRRHAALGGGRPAAQAAGIIIASAVVAAMFPGEALILASPSYSWLALSPLRGVLLVCPALLLWAWWIGGRSGIGLVNAVMPLVASALGHTPRAMVVHVRWLIEWAQGQLPTTRLQWGTAAIAAAFCCLLAGGLMSWWSKRRERSGLR